VCFRRGLVRVWKEGLWVGKVSIITVCVLLQVVGGGVGSLCCRGLGR
jgi:hypothetical protein